MGGKASILLVLSFSLIFLLFGHRFNNLSTRSVDNLMDYYLESKAHNIAVSAANMAANEIFMDKTWAAGYENISFEGGTINVYVTNTTVPEEEVPSHKVQICHDGNTIEVAAAAVAAFLAQGDELGACGSSSLGEATVTLISEGTFMGITKSVSVQLRPSYFSKFGNFYQNISALPATGDTFNGPFHVNTQLITWGTPVFWGKTTSLSGLLKNNAPPDPKFYGGFETGIDIPLEFDTTGMRSAADDDGYVFKDTTGTGQQTDVRLYYNADGTVEHSMKIGAGPWSTPITTPLSTFAPNGMIYVERGNIYTKGTLNGRITMVATKKGLEGAGEVWQEDDLQYNDDPRINPSSTDILGIVAEENIRLQYNDSTRGQDIITQASMFSLNGDVGPETALIDDPSLNRWLILGGIIADDIRFTARYDSYGPYKGYKFVHTYDERFMTYVPPNFPNTRNFEVVSWLE